MAEYGIAREFFKQYLTGFLVFVTNEPKPQQETPECVFVIIVFGSCRNYPFNFSCQITESAHKLRVGWHLIGIDCKLKPDKTDILGIDVQCKIFFDESIGEQSLFVTDNFLQIGLCLLRKGILRHRDYQYVFGLLYFTGKPFFLKMVKQAVNGLGINCIRDSECSVPLQGAVTYFVWQARNLLITRQCVQWCRNLVCQLRPLLWL